MCWHLKRWNCAPVGSRKHGGQESENTRRLGGEMSLMLSLLMVMVMVMVVFDPNWIDLNKCKFKMLEACQSMTVAWGCKHMKNVFCPNTAKKMSIQHGFTRPKWTTTLLPSLVELCVCTKSLGSIQLSKATVSSSFPLGWEGRARILVGESRKGLLWDIYKLLKNQPFNMEPLNFRLVQNDCG